MSSHRYERSSMGGDYGAQNPRFRNSRNSYARPSARDLPHRSPSPRRYSSPPPHDRKQQPNAGELKIKGASNQGARAARDVKYDDREPPRHSRPRSPSPRYAPRRSYEDRDRHVRRAISPIARDRDRERGRYRSPDMSRDRYHERSPDRTQYRSRSRSPGRRRDRSPYYGGPPSKEVILEGLPTDMLEDDIADELRTSHGIEKLDDVRVIRDRYTKASRCFGFVRFRSFEESKAFVEKHYPTISFHGHSVTAGGSGSASVRVAYSREREERGTQPQSGDWRCTNCDFSNFKGRTMCLQCKTVYDPEHVEMSAKPQFANSGDSDVAPDGTPSQFLIFRGLEPTVTEDLFARGASKLLKPSTRQSPPATSSKKGGSKMLSTTGDSNLGAKEGTLRRILLIRDRRTNESWRYGFAEFSGVDEAQAALTRYNSFDKFTIASKPVTVDYVHAGIFVPILEHDPHTEHFTFSPLSNAATRLAYWDQEAFTSELIVTEAPSNSDDKARESQVNGPNEEGLALADKDAKVKKRKADAKESSKLKKATPAHLQFWSDRHAELHGKKKVNDPEEQDLEASDQDSQEQVADNNSTESFVSFDQRCCWLCMRRFDSVAATSQHERLSTRHRGALQDENALGRAKAKLKQLAMPLREVPRTWIDLPGKCCYLCELEFSCMEDLSRHENLSRLHRQNLSNGENINKGKGILALENIAATISTDPYLDSTGRCCYLCMKFFVAEEDAFRHAYISQLHRQKLRDEATVKAVNSKLGKRHKIVPLALPSSFIDTAGKACYLCWKFFASEDEVRRHEGSSRVHRKNASSPDEIRAANARLGRLPGPEAETVDPLPEYRDRAAERRQAFGTSKKISLAFKKTSSKPEEPAESEVTATGPSKGASLLGKMGWSAGEGLGAQGTGMTAPVTTEMYAEGVGLGAQGSRIGNAVEEAGRNTKSDYREFLERTKDKAKERYEKMS